MPLQQMVIKYTVSTTNKKVYTEEEDRFLLVMLNKHGVEGEFIFEKIRDEIRESPLFRFDWFFLSRTPQEIGRRCKTLIDSVVREFGEGDVKNGRGKRALEEEETEDEEEVPVKKKAKNGVKVCFASTNGRRSKLTFGRISNSTRSRPKVRRLLRPPPEPPASYQTALQPPRVRAGARRSRREAHFIEMLGSVLSSRCLLQGRLVYCDREGRLPRFFHSWHRR